MRIKALGAGPCRLALYLCLSALLATPLLAQLYTGSLTGVVQDQTGAVIPQTDIMLLDTTKGYTWHATSDGTGRYLFPAVPPGTYRLRAEASGMNPFTADNLIMAVNQNSTFDVKLTVKTSSQSVEVVDRSPVMVTEDSVLGQTLDNNSLNNLPQATRGIFDMVYLTPGIVVSQNANGTSGAGTSFSSNGGRIGMSDVLMDGVSLTVTEQNAGSTQLLWTPTIDSVQEFKVEQGGFNAEVGYSGSTLVNMVTKSGTNEFHGDVYEFFRNNILNANDYFSNAAGQKLAPTHWNNFGGTVGGPIRRNKTFFFFDYDRLPSSTGETRSMGVPSAAERQGNFGELCTAGFDAAGMCSDSSQQLWDPYTATYQAAYGAPVATGYIPFNNLATYISPGNPSIAGTYPLALVPGNLIDPAAQKLMSWLPLPNLNVGTSAYNRYNNWEGSGAHVMNTNQQDLKIDHRFSDNDMLSVKASRQVGIENNSRLFPSSSPDPWSLGPDGSDGHGYLGSINYTHVFSPTMLMTLTGGITRQGANIPGPAAGTDFDYSKTLGMPEYMNDSGAKYLPVINVWNYNTTDGAQGWSTMKFGEDTLHLIGSLSKTYYRHEVKFGGEYRKQHEDWWMAGTPGGWYEYAVTGTSQYGWWGGGDEMASFLIGQAYGGQYTYDAASATTGNFWAGYVQDNWKVSDKLTLNIGLRYELEMPRTDRFGRGTELDLTGKSPLSAANMPLDGGVIFDNPPFDPNYRDWGPRFGFAYRVLNKTVLRGGYGIFYTLKNSGPSGTENGYYGYSMTDPLITRWAGDSAAPWGLMRDPWPGGPTPPSGSSLGMLTGVGSSIDGVMRAWNASPYEQSWSFGVERSLPGNSVVELNYVGKKGTHLYFAGDNNLDILPQSVAQDFAGNSTYWNTMVANPFFGVLPSSSSIGGPTVARWQLSLPYPQFTGVSADNDPAVANSIYHAFQARFEKRFSRGLQLQGYYVFSKSIDDASANKSSIASSAGGTRVVDPYDLGRERSLSTFDIPNVAELSYVWEFPIGRGRLLGGDMNRMLDAVVGGWKTSGEWKWASGAPLELSVNGGNAIPTYGALVPNLTGTLKRADNWTVLQYFADPSVALAPADYTIGNAPRTIGSVRSPGTNNADLAMMKDFSLTKIREGMRMEIRAEANNALNHPQFAAPNTTVGSSNFGMITSQANSPRTVQFGAKIYF